MAAKKTTGADAVEAYRKALIDQDVEALIGDLALKAGEWQQAIDNRRRGEIQLRRAEEKAEDAVAAAYEKARDAGAKPAALERAGLKPTTALTSVAKRASKTRVETATHATAAAEVPLTPPPADTTTTEPVAETAKAMKESA